MRVNPAGTSRSSLGRLVTGIAAALLLILVAAVGPLYMRMKAMADLARAMGVQDDVAGLYQTGVELHQFNGTGWIPGAPEIRVSLIEKIGSGIAYHVVERWEGLVDLAGLGRPRTEFLQKALRGDPVAVAIVISDDTDCAAVAEALRRFPKVQILLFQARKNSPPAEQIALFQAAVRDLKECQCVTLSVSITRMGEDQLAAWCGIPNVRDIMAEGELESEIKPAMWHAMAGAPTMAELYCRPVPDVDAAMAAITKIRPATLKKHSPANQFVIVELGPMPAGGGKP